MVMLMHPLALKLFFGVNPNSVLHVGAHHAEEFRTYERTWSNETTYTWIEANPELIPILSELLPKSHRIIEAAVWSTERLTDFNIMNNSQASSILELKDHMRFYPDIAQSEKLIVQTKTLDKLFAEIKFDFINLDIQGAELEALKGFQEGLHATNWIYCEVNLIDLYKNGAHVEEIDEFLQDYGFERIVTKWTHARWGDALYVRQKQVRWKLVRIGLFYVSLRILSVMHKLLKLNGILNSKIKSKVFCDCRRK